MTLTDRTAVTGGPRSKLGYWELAPGTGESHQARSDLLPARTGSAIRDFRPLLTIAHLSDLHLCDSQSPARAEFLDRWADPDSPLRSALGIIWSYRAQEILSVQVGAAMIDAVNRVATGPIGSAEIDWAITTGDAIDSAQRNELGWYIELLDGGDIVPDSGSPARYEGVADDDYWHEAYWHPDPSIARDGTSRRDRPRRLFGFPDVPGLLDAVRLPVHSPGLAMPWLAVHGNHDQLVQGNIPATGPFAEASLADRKAFDVPADWSVEQIGRFCGSVASMERLDPGQWPDMPTRPITPDVARRFVTRGEFVAAHFGGKARPVGHGFGSAESSCAYYRRDHGPVSVLVLDAVNEHGGWQGSLDAPQLAWLEAELDDADRERRYVVLASHHTLADFVNGRSAPGAPRRILTSELDEILDRHPCLVLWLNGHTHITAIRPHVASTARHAWWEVTAPSLIDFPQQGRIVEVLKSAGGTMTIAVTMLDHSGELPWSGNIDSVMAMAGLSRQLAANDWQLRPDDLAAHPLIGTPQDRNVLLHLPDPFAG